MVYCAILGKNSPAARDLGILLVFYQHPRVVYQPINNGNLWSIANNVDFIICSIIWYR